MIKKFSAAFFAIFLTVIFCSCSLVKTEPIKTIQIFDVPCHMTVLGDSIAAGYGLDGYTASDNDHCDSYANILKAQFTEVLQDQFVHVTWNFAVSGSESDDLLDLLNSGEIDAQLADSDVVMISIGGNDLLHIMLNFLSELGIKSKTSFDLDSIDLLSAAAALITMDSEIDKALEHFEDNLIQIRTKLNETTDAKIFIQTLYNPLENFDKIPALVDFSEEKIGRLNEIIVNNADSQYYVVDVAAEFKGKSSELTRIGSLDIHPNEDGHKLIAEIYEREFSDFRFEREITEEGKPQLTLTAILLVISGILATMVVVMIIIPLLFKKNDKKNSLELKRDK